MNPSDAPNLQQRAQAGVDGLVAPYADGGERFAFVCELLKACGLQLIEGGKKPVIAVDIVWAHGSVRLFSSDRGPRDPGEAP
jgi:hypothetical protein